MNESTFFVLEIGQKNQDFIKEINLISWNDIYHKLTYIGLLVN